MTRVDGGKTPASRLQQTQQLAEGALDDLAAELASGNSRQLTAFLSAMGRFHSYSVQNLMLILAQRPDAARVAGFQTWKSLGRSVCKGEKGIAIIAPMRIRNKDSSEKTASSSDQDDADRASFLRFRVVYVFDIAQTDGEPLPDLAKVSGDPGAVLALLEAGVRRSGIVLQDSDELGSADGVSKGGEIVLSSSLAPAERFSVLVHELAHELLHHRGEEPRPSKTVRETEAEAVAFAVCHAVGTETNGAAADYIRLYRGDAETLAESLDRIRGATASVVGMIEQERAETSQRVGDSTAPKAAPSIDATAMAHARRRLGAERG